MAYAYAIFNNVFDVSKHISPFAVFFLFYVVDVSSFAPQTSSLQSSVRYFVAIIHLIFLIIFVCYCCMHWILLVGFLTHILHLIRVWLQTRFKFIF